MRRPPLDVEMFVSNFDDQYTKMQIDIDINAEIISKTIDKPFGNKVRSKSTNIQRLKDENLILMNSMNIKESIRIANQISDA